MAVIPAIFYTSQPVPEDTRFPGLFVPAVVSGGLFPVAITGCLGVRGFVYYSSLPARKSSLFIHGQGVDVVQEVANLFGRQRWRALSEVQFDALQKQRFFSGKGVDINVDASKNVR